MASKSLRFAAGLLAAGGAAALALPLAGKAQAPSGIDVIAVRKAGQDLVAADYTGMAQAVKGNVQDVKPFANAATALEKWEQQFITMFPPGSDKGETKALPAIWTDRAGFEEAAHNLATAAAKVAASAHSGDRVAFAADVKALGDACTACHKKFKAK